MGSLLISIPQIVGKVLKELPNTCHNFRTEGFQKPIKPFLFENRDLFGNPVTALHVGRWLTGWRIIGAKLIWVTKCWIHSKCTIMKGLPNICHHFRTEVFQIPIKPLMLEDRDLFGNLFFIIIIIRLQNKIETKFYLSCSLMKVVTYTM